MLKLIFFWNVQTGPTRNDRNDSNLKFFIKIGLETSYVNRCIIKNQCKRCFWRTRTFILKGNQTRYKVPHNWIVHWISSTHDTVYFHVWKCDYKTHLKSFRVNMSVALMPFNCPSSMFYVSWIQTKLIQKDKFNFLSLKPMLNCYTFKKSAKVFGGFTIDVPTLQLSLG